MAERLRPLRAGNPLAGQGPRIQPGPGLPAGDRALRRVPRPVRRHDDRPGPLPPRRVLPGAHPQRRGSRRGGLARRPRPDRRRPPRPDPRGHPGEAAAGASVLLPPRRRHRRRGPAAIPRSRPGQGRLGDRPEPDRDPLHRPASGRLRAAFGRGRHGLVTPEQLPALRPHRPRGGSPEGGRPDRPGLRLEPERQQEPARRAQGRQDRRRGARRRVRLRSSRADGDLDAGGHARLGCLRRVDREGQAGGPADPGGRLRRSVRTARLRRREPDRRRGGRRAAQARTPREHALLAGPAGDGADRRPALHARPRRALGADAERDDAVERSREAVLRARQHA